MRAGGAAGRRCRSSSPIAKRAPLTERVLIVGNLIGAATVQAVPKINGRLQSVDVQLGDQVRRGEVIAKVEDREIQEQVRQAEAAYRVGEATIRQREADLKLAQTNLERNKSLLERQLLPKQTYDDTDARYQAAVAQLDLARAQFEQSKARLDELKINAGEHDDRVAGRRLRRKALSGSGSDRQPERPGRVRSSTSAPCAWSPTSSRRT